MDKINKDAYYVPELTPTGNHKVLRIDIGEHKCQECGALIQIENFDDNHANRDNEPVNCPKCGAFIGNLRTSGFPHVEVIK